MAKDTKQKIIYAALEIFARDGYAGTNIKDIADEVGIVKSALYRHFESKEEIWNAVFEEIINYYNSRFSLSKIPQNTDELYEMTMQMLNFTIHDKSIISMRKILHTEQFRDDKVKALASHYFLYDTKDMFTKIFAEMIKNGKIKEDDPEILALSYTAPITGLIHLCDREPDKEKEVMKQIDLFINHFINTYGVK